MKGIYFYVFDVIELKLNCEKMICNNREFILSVSDN